MSVNRRRRTYGPSWSASKDVREGFCDGDMADISGWQRAAGNAGSCEVDYLRASNEQRLLRRARVLGKSKISMLRESHRPF
jgi:hypothetical protein